VKYVSQIPQKSQKVSDDRLSYSNFALHIFLNAVSVYSFSLFCIRGNLISGSLLSRLRMGEGEGARGGIFIFHLTLKTSSWEYQSQSGSKQ
jgi:hypothetical protein